MAYINSTQITAFPVVNRNANVSGDIYARHTSEEIMSGIVNKLIDTDGFVVTTKDYFSLDKQFSFNVHGYYFKLNRLQDLLTLFEIGITKTPDRGDEIYAEIGLKNYGTWNQWVELMGQDQPKSELVTDDTEYVYSGVNFIYVPAGTSYTPSTSDYVTYAQALIKYDTAEGWDGGWYVPEKNYVKFCKSSFVIERIDGGDLDKI